MPNMFSNLFGGSSEEANPETTNPNTETTTSEASVTGLDKWKGLVDNKASEGKGSEEDTPIFDPVSILKNPEAIEKISNSLDFTSSISPETQQKLASNEPDGIISLVSDVGKAAYLQAIQHSTALTQQHITDLLAKQEKGLSSNIQSHLKDHELEQVLPDLKNPIVRLGTQQFVKELRNQQPNISSQDIAKEVKDYLKELANTINPATPEPKPKRADQVDDWMAEMGF